MWVQSQTGSYTLPLCLAVSIFIVGLVVLDQPMIKIGEALLPTTPSGDVPNAEDKFHIVWNSDDHWDFNSINQFWTPSFIFLVKMCIIACFMLLQRFEF